MTGLEDVTVALTLWRPWHAIMLVGPKDIENRPWPAPSSIIGTRIALHAGKKFDEIGWLKARDILIRTGFDSLDPAMLALGLVSGAIVGTAIVAECVRWPDERPPFRNNPWFFGPFGWQLIERKPLPAPIPCRGFQGLWPIPRDLRGAPAVSP